MGWFPLCDDAVLLAFQAGALPSDVLYRQQRDEELDGELRHQQPAGGVLRRLLHLSSDRLQYELHRVRQAALSEVPHAGRRAISSILKHFETF